MSEVEDRPTLFPRSMELFERAARVIPGGVYGHTSPAVNLPLRSPYFAARAEGCRYWDVDGREYIDLMCAYGPNVLGYNHPEVESAAAQQRAAGNAFNHPTERMVELAERLCALIDFADWGVFGRNGSDMTTWALSVAREATQRKKVLKVKGAYHGVDPWCTPGHGGLIEEDRAHIHEFAWNDLDSFNELMRTHAGQVAAVILTPFHHPAFGDSVLPADGFLPGIEAACRREGSLLILDDIRAGFRLHLSGSHRAFGFTPDIACYCKALANGYPISAAVGAHPLRVAASRVFLTGSYWNNAVPMAAALKTLELIEGTQAIETMRQRGKQLFDGLRALGERYEKPFVLSGPPAMPYVRFAHENDFRDLQTFCAACMEHGLFLHPHHNGFLCAAHTEADITEALQRTDSAFRQVFG
ncbi:MAG: aminotransferase class III-fold pyridoxal phosphate-dependent enzyme [Opitutales bacterium]